MSEYFLAGRNDGGASIDPYSGPVMGAGTGLNRDADVAF